MADTQEPTEIVQGTVYSWSRAFGDYDATYTLTYEIRGLSSTLTLTGTPGTGWAVAISAAQSAAFASKATDRFVLDTGSLVVVADLATSATAAIAQSSARKRLAVYQAMAENVAYIKTLSPDQMEALERIMKSLQWDVKREEDAEKLKRGGYPTRKIFTRFTEAGV
jgi:broad-specificity NMP kinase